MRHLRGIILRTRASIFRITGGLTDRMETLEKAIASQEQRYINKNANEGPSTHAMEVEEHHRVMKKDAMHESLSDQDLRVYLEQKYGKTKWAARLVNEILEKRVVS